MHFANGVSAQSEQNQNWSFPDLYCLNTVFDRLTHDGWNKLEQFVQFIPVFTSLLHIGKEHRDFGILLAT